MRHSGWVFWVAIPLALAFVGGGGAAVAAKETFKDEAGRVIYEIDDDGAVTMYEKSPSDQIISIATGTREQMRPLVDEVTPDRITAGAFTILRFTGRNLVGAKAKFSVPDIEVGPYVGKPESLDLPISVPATLPAGEVSLEITTPIGITKASFKVAGLEIGGMGSSRRENEGKKPVTTSAPSSCPEGMIGVPFEMGGFCIEIDHTVRGDIRKAEKACAAGGKRLCQAPEWRQACEQVKAGGLPLSNMLGDWEWTGSWESFDSPMTSMPFVQSILLGKADCQAKQVIPMGKGEVFPSRCCK